MRTTKILSLVLFMVFTISLTESIEISDSVRISDSTQHNWFVELRDFIGFTDFIQFADGLTASGKQMTYELNVGETQMLTWKVINDEEVPINLEFFATGEGSEFFIFEKFITMDPKQVKEFEILVKIPNDHKDNIEYHIKLFALKKGIVESSGAQLVINVQMETHPVIKIGDNPIFTSPIVDQSIEKPVEEPIKETTNNKPIEEEIETIEEKLARIKAANQENIKEEPTTPVKEITKSTPIIDKEPEMDVEPVEEKKCGTGTELVNGICKVIKTKSEPDGGCLIATATYGTELAPQVQLLREIRDNQLLNTESGKIFMGMFNDVYYSFSPIIADYERENPLFQQAVRVFITPMISSLSIMTLTDGNSESKVLGLGISVIVLNLGLYIAVPASIGFKIHNHFKSRK